MRIKKYDTSKGPPMKDGKYVPHLALIEDASGEAIMIPPGAMVVEIMDPTSASAVLPLILMKVSRKGWYFRCGCKKPGCDRFLRMRPEWGGRHIFNDTTKAYSNPEEPKSEDPSPKPGVETPEE